MIVTMSDAMRGFSASSSYVLVPLSLATAILRLCGDLRDCLTLTIELMWYELVRTDVVKPCALPSGGICSERGETEGVNVVPGFRASLRKRSHEVDVCEAGVSKASAFRALARGAASRKSARRTVAVDGQDALVPANGRLAVHDEFLGEGAGQR